MPLLSPRRIHRATHRVIAAVVAVGLLSMPVTYRGGAETAHAHTIFQLWADVRSGSFTHHGGYHGASAADVATGHGHAATDAASMGDSPRGVETAGSRGVVGPDRLGGAAIEPVTGSPAGTTARELEGDAPAMSSAFTPEVRGTALALSAAPHLPLAESFHSADRGTRVLAGIAHAPTAPPPRRAA